MSNNEKIPTINDVAREAGVSKRTVSRVINKSDKVNDKTRIAVQKVIDALNYTPSSQARGLAANRSFLLGLIYDVPTLFVNAVQKGILSVSADEGYDIVVHPCEFGSQGLVKDVERFVNRSKVDGVIMLPPISDIPAMGKVLDNIGIPHVRFASELTDESWRLVITDYGPAIDNMTQHLFDMGHRDIGFISGPSGNLSSNKRQQAFVEALASHGLTLQQRFIAEGAFTYDSGVIAATKLLSAKVRPTAIFAANDEMAFALMNVAHSIGLSIPQQLSVVGFDGTRFSSFFIPSLSTIRRPSQEMASLSARKLLAFIKNGIDGAAAFECMVSPQFVARQSSGPAPDPSA